MHRVLALALILLFGFLAFLFTLPGLHHMDIQEMCDGLQVITSHLGMFVSFAMGFAFAVEGKTRK